MVLFETINEIVNEGYDLIISQAQFSSSLKFTIRKGDKRIDRLVNKSISEDELLKIILDLKMGYDG